MDQFIPPAVKMAFDNTIAKHLSNAPPSAPPKGALPPIPPKSIRRRLAQTTEDLILNPQTITEWTMVMAEVKELYNKGNYKQCSGRAKQLLEGIQNSQKTHPIYSVYLAFFAASSLELTSRSLQSNAAAKLPLLQEALLFYQKAESYMEAATSLRTPTSPGLRKHRSDASISSSIRSSVDSIFSQTSNTSSILDAPDGPPISILHTPQPFRIKKTIRFQETISESEYESPDAMNRFPPPPTRNQATPKSTSYKSTARPKPKSAEKEPPPQPQTDFPFLHHPLSLARYHASLAALSAQLEYHMSSISAQIRTLLTIRRARRSNLPDLFVSSELGRSTLRGLKESGVDDEDVKRVDIQERIRRGRENGWNRQRFDAGRYRKLCEVAVAECDGGDVLN